MEGLSDLEAMGDCCDGGVYGIRTTERVKGSGGETGSTGGQPARDGRIVTA